MYHAIYCRLNATFYVKLKCAFFNNKRWFVFSASLSSLLRLTFAVCKWCGKNCEYIFNKWHMHMSHYSWTTNSKSVLPEFKGINQIKWPFGRQIDLQNNPFLFFCFLNKQLQIHNTVQSTTKNQFIFSNHFILVCMSGFYSRNSQCDVGINQYSPVMACQSIPEHNTHTYSHLESIQNRPPDMFFWGRRKPEIPEEAHATK